GSRTGLLAEKPEFVGGSAATVDVGEMLRADQNVVARGQMHDPKKGGAGYATGDAADNAGLQVNDERIAEAFIHESNTLIVGRDVGPLTEVGQHLNVFRQMVKGIAGLPLPVRGHGKG